MHFEHCYALDESGASVDARKECWRDWLHGYTYGQSRDRVEYGGTRYSELSLDPTLPSEDTPSSRAKHIVAAPVPTNAFAPPPNVSGGGAIVAVAHAPGPTAPTGVAALVVVPLACKQSGCDVCDQAYKTCMPGCFRDDAAYTPARTLRSAPRPARDAGASLRNVNRRRLPRRQGRRPRARLRSQRRAPRQ